VSGRRLLSRRVALLASAVIGAWLIVLLAGFNVYIDRKLRGDLASSLRVRAQAAVATLVIDRGRITGVRDVAHDADLDNGVWVIANGQPVAGSAVGAAPSLVTAAASRPAGAVSRPGEQLLYVEPVTRSGKRIGAVVVAASTDGIHNAAVITLLSSLVVGGLLLAGVYLVIRQTITRALSPVADMTGQAEAWSIDDPGRRFGDTQRFAELATLAHTLDALLDRVAAVLRHERALTGDLSHELRTPLARIKAETELVVGVDGKADEQAIAGIRESTARMERIIDALLTSARTEHAADQGRCAVGQAIGAALEACHRDDVEVTVVTTPPDLHAGVDFAVCERIIAPLVDNGARFAKDRLAIHAHASDGRVHIDVTNDGPPLPDRARMRPIRADTTVRGLASPWRGGSRGPRTVTCFSASSTR
jgi:signal transduction histidine kinase